MDKGIEELEAEIVNRKKQAAERAKQKELAAKTDQNTKGPAEEVDQKGPVEPTPWRAHFNERQLKEIEFARTYARDFAHGATNHNSMIIMASMADLLDFLEGQTKGMSENEFTARVAGVVKGSI